MWFFLIHTSKGIKRYIYHSIKGIAAERRFYGKVKKKHQALYKELSSYKEKGILLLLNEKPSSPKKIAAACQAQEENTYMRDYYSDEDNNIIGINFQKIHK